MSQSIEELLNELPCGDNQNLKSSARVLNFKESETQIEILLNGSQMDFNEKVQLEKSVRETIKENSKKIAIVKFKDSHQPKISVEKYDPKKVLLKEGLRGSNMSLQLVQVKGE